MLALCTSPPLVTAAQAERVAGTVYGLAVSATALSGERDCNFRLRTADNHEYVLKIIDAAASREAIDCQIGVLRHLAEQDPTLPVPRLIATASGEDLGRIETPGAECAIYLMSYLPGELLAARQPDAPLLDQVGGTLARLDRALRGFFHAGIAQRLAWDVRRLPELIEHAALIEPGALRDRVAAVSVALEARLPALRALRNQAIHGDCHAHNVLIDPAHRAVSGVLDFGDIIHAPLVLEPAVAMSELLTGDLAPLDALSAVVRGYAQVLPLEAADIDVLFDLIAARHAVMILVHAYRSRYDQRGALALAAMAGRAAHSLEALLVAGREALTPRWHDAAGTSTAAQVGTAVRVGSAAGTSTSAHGGTSAQGGGGVLDGVAATVDLARRRRLMGAAELFYDQPLHLVRGSGVSLYDAEGRAYLDAYNNVAHVGHAHPTVVAAIQRQTATLATHTRYLHAGILDYAERLTATLPAHLDACIFVNSGSEANDVAWRIARFATGQRGGLVMEHAYHGITDAVAALTPSAGEPRDPHVVTLAAPPDGVDSGDEFTAAQLRASRQDVERAIARLRERDFAPAAFFIDSSMTSSGVFDPPPEWARAVSDCVRGAGGLIVADEVQYGLGRSGSHFWSFSRRGLSPDIVTLGKPIGNGYPMGAVIANRALIEAFQARCGFFSTFGGNAVAAAAGLAVLEVLEREQLMANARDTGAYLTRALAAMASRHPCLGRIRGSGLLLGLEVLGLEGGEFEAGATVEHSARARAKRIINILASRARILIGYEGPQASVLKLRPPMPFCREHADRLVAALDLAATEIDATS